MRTLALLALLAPAVASAEPTQLPDVCVADAPVDEPCTALRGRYRFEIVRSYAEAPRCVIGKKLAGTLTITSVKGPPSRLIPTFKLTSLRKALRLTATPEVSVGVGLRDGVCCIDLRIRGPLTSTRNADLKINFAAGASLVGTRAKASWQEANGIDDCEDVVEMTAKKLK